MEIVLVWVALSLAVGLLAVKRGRSGIGWGLGALVFSPLLAVIFLMLSRNLSEASDAPHPNTHVKCPDCAELVRSEAKVCKHCGCRLVPQAPAA